MDELAIQRAARDAGYKGEILDITVEVEGDFVHVGINDQPFTWWNASLTKKKFVSSKGYKIVSAAYPQVTDNVLYINGYTYKGECWPAFVEGEFEDEEDAKAFAEGILEAVEEFNLKNGFSRNPAINVPKFFD